MKKFLLCILASAIVFAGALSAQDKDITGTWQGTLQAGRALRTVVKISKNDGVWKSVFYSIDQGGQPLPVTKTTLDGLTVTMSIMAIDGKFEGKLSPDGTTIAGSWTQGPSPLPLTLVKATNETAWAIPEPPARIPPMAADASPSFDVATIKPSKPEQQGKGFRVQGRRFTTINTSLTDLITFAYGLHPKQVVGGPEWMGTEKFDLEGQPDLPGSPNDAQWKGMIKKLLTERFGLAFHHDKKELSVYALTVAKTGQKMTKSDSDQPLPGLFFRGLGVLTVQNATMPDFCNLMETAVLDRPVVDQTAIAGRWNFLLKWTPDESQFAGMGVKVPAPTDTANAPPPLFTAIQEQIGLKLDPTKTAVEILAVDKVTKPSDN